MKFSMMNEDMKKKVGFVMKELGLTIDRHFFEAVNALHCRCPHPKGWGPLVKGVSVEFKTSEDMLYWYCGFVTGFSFAPYLSGSKDDRVFPHPKS